MESRGPLIDQLLQANNLPEVDTSLATTVSDEYLKIALTAYENARMDGLCHDGAWECAVDVMQQLIAELQKEKQHA